MPPKRPGGAGGQEVPGELSAKPVVVGEAFVGKSCLAARVSKNEFSPTQEPTIGAAFVSYRTTINGLAGNAAAAAAGVNGDTATVKFEIWDTAGQERFRSLTPMYFRGAVAGLVVYDISSADTLRKAKAWIQDLRKTRDQLAIVLVGNKADLPDDKRQITTEEGQELADEEQIGFFETSAKTGANVKEVFDQVAKDVVTRNLAQPAKQPIGVVGGPGGGGDQRGGKNPVRNGGNGGGSSEGGCSKC